MKTFGNTDVNQAKKNVSDALTFVPNTKIKEVKDECGKVISREIVSIF